MLRNICLDIPHPAWITAAAKAPPVAFGSQGDVAVLTLIQQMGESLGRREEERRQACNLAAGPSDIVIVLERPSKDHNYNVSFEDFVAGSPTLTAINELIVAATKAARSIYTVTVIDAFAFKPISPPEYEQGWREPSDTECQALFMRVLKLKNPKVILCCTGHPAICDYLDEHFSAILYKAKHPGHSVNWNRYSAELRFHLLLDFIAAFGLLGPGALEYSVTNLKDMYRFDKSVEQTKKEDLHFAFVSRFHSSFCKDCACYLAGLRIEEVCRTWNATIQSSSYSGGSLRIAEMILLLKGYRPAAGKLQVRRLQDALMEIGLKQSELVETDPPSIPELVRTPMAQARLEASSGVVPQESQKEINAECTGLSVADKQAIDERVRERINVLIEEQAQVVVQQRIEEEIKRQVNVHIQERVDREVEQRVQQERRSSKEAIETASRAFVQRILDVESATVGIIEQRLEQQQQALQEEYQQRYDAALQQSVQQEQQRYEKALHLRLEEEQRRLLAEQQRLQSTLEEQQRLKRLLDEQPRLLEEAQQHLQREEQRLKEESEQRLEEEVEQRVVKAIQQQREQQTQYLVDQEIQQQLMKQKLQERLAQRKLGQSQIYRPANIIVRLPGRPRVLMPWAQPTLPPSSVETTKVGATANVVRDDTGSKGPGARSEGSQTPKRSALKKAPTTADDEIPRITGTVDQTRKVISQRSEVLPSSSQENGQNKDSRAINPQQQQRQDKRKDRTSEVVLNAIGEPFGKPVTPPVGDHWSLKQEVPSETTAFGNPSVKRLEFRFQNLRMD